MVSVGSEIQRMHISSLSMFVFMATVSWNKRKKIPTIGYIVQFKGHNWNILNILFSLIRI